MAECHFADILRRAFSKVILLVKSGQFHGIRMISNNAHAIRIYIFPFIKGELYTQTAWALLVTNSKAVQSLTAVMSYSSHAFSMFNFYLAWGLLTCLNYGV